MNMPISIFEARQILGKESVRLSDKEIAELLQILNGLAADLFELEEHGEL